MGWGSITVDLSVHTDELKKAIVKALIDKFFSNQFERGSVTASPQRERKVRKCRMKLKFFKSGADRNRSNKVVKGH